MKFRMGEFFSGPGGIAHGADIAVQEFKKKYPHIETEIQHIWANDIDESACATYKENIQPQFIYNEPVQQLNIEGLPPINSFAFGFPCNDYSNVGERKGLNGDYGPLYTYGVKVLNHHKPDWFIAENVSGLQSANDGSAFKNILLDLAKATEHGYRLTPHLYKFEEYGVPQARHRIIIVGIRGDIKLNDKPLSFKIPAPTHKDNYVSAQFAIENPPIPEDALNHEYTKHSEDVIRMLSYLDPGDNAWSPKIPEHLRLNVKGAKLSQIYKRLEPDKPAYTVTGSGGGGTHVYHWKEPRALTNRERARLQTFPDKYVFHGKKEKVRQQIGMAVPPQGVKAIFEAILKTFAGIEYESIESEWFKSQGINLEAKREKVTS